jgi:hypothetical protein
MVEISTRHGALQSASPRRILDRTLEVLREGGRPAAVEVGSAKLGAGEVRRLVEGEARDFQPDLCRRNGDREKMQSAMADGAIEVEAGGKMPLVSATVMAAKLGPVAVAQAVGVDRLQAKRRQQVDDEQESREPLSENG